MARNNNLQKSLPASRWFRDESSSLVAALMIGLFCFCILPTNAQQSSSSNSQQGRQLSLKQQLTVGLKAVTPGDKAFIDLVVFRVEQGVLPRTLVNSTFLWARQKADARGLSPRVPTPQWCVSEARSPLPD